MSTHRLCCCNPPTPGSCASLMCVKSNPSTVVMTGISGVKRYWVQENNINPCTDDSCNSVDFDSFYWQRRASLLEQVEFAIGPTVLTRVGTSCCYIAQIAQVDLTWVYSRVGPYWMHCRCSDGAGGFQNGPLWDGSDTITGTTTAPACYRVECVTDSATNTQYLMHRLSWCRVPAPGIVTEYADPATDATLCDPPVYTVSNTLGLYISPQQICWRSPVIPLVAIAPGDYVRQYWCGCDYEGFDSGCVWAAQTVYPCLTASCSGDHQTFPYPFDYAAVYDPENPPAPCLQCGPNPPHSYERCGGIVNMCYGGQYENNTVCYDCEHTLLVGVPDYV